jgi:hypothetical protein
VLVNPCCCGEVGCSFTVTGIVNACRAERVPGATVEARDGTATGTLLGTTTTDSGGNYTLSASGATAGHDVAIVVSYPTRLDDAVFILFWTSAATDFGSWDCDAAVTLDPIAMPAAEGYHCSLAACFLPLPDTLSASVGGGSATLTYDAGIDIWWGVATTSKDIETGMINSAAGCCTGCCGTWDTGGSLNVTLAFDGVTLYETWSYQSNADDSALTCPQFGYVQQTADSGPTPTFGFVDSLCTAEFVPTTQTVEASATPACPPGFSWSGTVDSLGFADGREPPLVGSGSVTE